MAITPGLRVNLTSGLHPHEVPSGRAGVGRDIKWWRRRPHVPRAICAIAAGTLAGWMIGSGTQPWVGWAIIGWDVRYTLRWLNPHAEDRHAD